MSTCPTEPNAGAPDATLSAQGFAFVPGGVMRALLSREGSLGNWDEFAGSWDRLTPDAYLAARGRHRRRRFAVFRLERDSAPRRMEHQPHYQALQYNTLQGGIERWFDPVEADVGASPAMQSLLRFGHGLFGSLQTTCRSWRVEVHQFRIEAQPGSAGHPTPEGVHRDGVDFVLVLMIRRHNIASGTTTIHAPDGSRLGAFTLTTPLDAALVDDRRVHHGVTPVHALVPGEPAYRDVLVLTFRGESAEL